MFDSQRLKKPIVERFHWKLNAKVVKLLGVLSRVLEIKALTCVELVVVEILRNVGRGAVVTIP